MMPDCPDMALPMHVMQHVMRVESSFNPYAIGVVGGRLERQPRNLPEAVATARMLEKNGFNLLGSRSADGRVPSIWMSQNAPRLGAVWPNSRRTWLGNAYCTARRGVSLFR